MKTQETWPSHKGEKLNLEEEHRRKLKEEPLLFTKENLLNRKRWRKEFGEHILLTSIFLGPKEGGCWGGGKIILTVLSFGGEISDEILGGPLQKKRGGLN